MTKGKNEIFITIKVKKLLVQETRYRKITHNLIETQNQNSLILRKKFRAIFAEFFGIPFVKVATSSKFLLRWFRVGKSDGSINRGEGILKGGYTTTKVSVIGEAGRCFYRSSKSGARKSVVDYGGILWLKNFFHPRLIRVDPR